MGKQFKKFLFLNPGKWLWPSNHLGNKPFYGNRWIARRSGHIVLDKNCNRKGLEGLCGTLEALASGYGLADIARENAKLDSDSVLHVFDPEEIDAKIVFEAASNGDRLANEIIDGAAGYLSIGIDTLIKLFNTECVVLAGGLVQNGDSIIEKIRLQVAEYSLSGVSRSVPIVKAGFGVNAALMGSFSLILERILLLESID